MLSVLEAANDTVSTPNEEAVEERVNEILNELTDVASKALEKAAEELIKKKQKKDGLRLRLGLCLVTLPTTHIRHAVE